jgi:hypothetical protein
MEGRSNEAIKRLQQAGYQASINKDQASVDWINNEIAAIQDTKRQRQPGEAPAPPVFNADGSLNPSTEGHLRAIEQKYAPPQQAAPPAGKLSVEEVYPENAPPGTAPKLIGKVTEMPNTPEALANAKRTLEAGTDASAKFAKDLQADQKFVGIASQMSREAAQQGKPAPTTAQVLEEYYKQGGTVRQAQPAPAPSPVTGGQQGGAPPSAAAPPMGAKAIRSQAESMMSEQQIIDAQNADNYRGSSSKMPASWKDAKRVRDQIEERLRFPKKGASAEGQSSEQQLWNQLLADLEYNPLTDSEGNTVNPNSALGQAMLTERWNAEHPAQMSRGGVVGYQGGGAVGATDTVPAMLTPGEFVMNRDAVQNIGVDALRAMNQTGMYEAQTSKSQVASAPNFGGTLTVPGLQTQKTPAQRLAQGVAESQPKPVSYSAPAAQPVTPIQDSTPPSTTGSTTTPASLPPSNAGIMVTHFGYPGDKTPDPASARGEGAYVKSMVSGYDVALNKAAARQLGASPGKEFQYLGKTYRYGDAVPEIYPEARLDVFDPYSKARD